MENHAIAALIAIWEIPIILAFIRTERPALLALFMADMYMLSAHRYQYCGWNGVCSDSAEVGFIMCSIMAYIAFTGPRTPLFIAGMVAWVLTQMVEPYMMLILWTASRYMWPFDL